jgi:hypothetical protein
MAKHGSRGAQLNRLRHCAPAVLQRAKDDPMQRFGSWHPRTGLDEVYSL